MDQNKMKISIIAYNNQSWRSSEPYSSIVVYKNKPRVLIAHKQLPLSWGTKLNENTNLI